MSHLARLNADGTLDTSFLNGLAGANGSVNALFSQSDDSKHQLNQVHVQ